MAYNADVDREKWNRLHEEINELPVGAQPKIKQKYYSQKNTERKPLGVQETFIPNESDYSVKDLSWITDMKQFYGFLRYLTENEIRIPAKAKFSKALIKSAREEIDYAHIKFGITETQTLKEKQQEQKINLKKQ
jgi:hypothetical protein